MKSIFIALVAATFALTACDRDDNDVVTSPTTDEFEGTGTRDTGVGTDTGVTGTGTGLGTETGTPATGTTGTPAAGTGATGTGAP